MTELKGIDREAAQRAREQAEWDAAHPDGPGNEAGQTP